MVAVSSAEVGRTWFSGRDTEGLAASLMRTTGGALSTGVDEHPASTAPAAAIAMPHCGRLICSHPPRR